MRLLSFELPNDSALRVGALAHDGGRVVDLTEIGVASLADATGRVPELRRVIDHLVHAPGAAAHALSGVRLRAPAVHLRGIWDSATGERVAPVRDDSAVRKLCGAEAAVAVGADATSFEEYGAGLACVIGRPAAGIAARDAEDYVVGLAALNCWRPGIAPGGATVAAPPAAALGPWLLTLDELAGRRHGVLTYELEAAIAVNRRPLRRGSWRALAGKLARAVAEASHAQALAPGDAVAVATFELARTVPDEHDGDAPPGTAAGDEVVLEVEQLGVLRNWVAPGRAAVSAAQR